MENKPDLSQSLVQRIRSLFSSFVRAEKNELQRRVPYWIWSMGLLFAGFVVMGLALGWLTFMGWSLLRDGGLNESEAAAFMLLLLGAIAGALFTVFSFLRKEERARRKEAFLQRQSEFNSIESQGTQLVGVFSEFSKDIAYVAKEALDPKEIIGKHATKIVAGAAVFGFLFGVRRANALRVDAVIKESEDNNLEGVLL